MNELEIVFYTRKECSLCDKAKRVVMDVAGKFEGRVTLKEIDIDTHEDLRLRLNDRVPLVFLGDRQLFKHRIDPEMLERHIQSALRPMSWRPAWWQFSRKGKSMALTEEQCVPCRGGVPALKGQELQALQRELGGDWNLVDEHHLSKEFRFPDFKEALAFTNAVGAIAEEQGHHPDIYLAWGKVRIEVWTHKIDGLTRSDFVLAAKVDAAGS